MKKIFKNYKSTIILILAIIIGGVIGGIFGEKAKVLSPFGDVFLNLLFVVIVPLIFLTLSTSVAKMREKKRLGKIMRTIILVFVFTSLVACLRSYKGHGAVFLLLWLLLFLVLLVLLWLV